MVFFRIRCRSDPNGMKRKDTGKYALELGDLFFKNKDGKPCLFRIIKETYSVATHIAFQNKPDGKKDYVA